MKENNFGFKGLSSDIDQKFSRDFASLRPKKLKEVFGQKSFETSWQFIETLI